MLATEEQQSSQTWTAEERHFVESFEALTWPHQRFRHVDHVRLGWIYLRVEPVDRVLVRYGRALRRYAAALGHPDRYHQTITWAYVLLINERMERCGRACSWEAFCRANPDLMAWQSSPLQSCYRSETLHSELARRVFVFPDLARGPEPGGGQG